MMATISGKPSLPARANDSGSKPPMLARPRDVFVVANFEDQLQFFAEQRVVILEVQTEKWKRFGKRAAPDDHFRASSRNQIECGELLEHAHWIDGNARMWSQQLGEWCVVDSSTKELLKAAINPFSLSGRGYDRILKVSRTIAELEPNERIELHHVAEAVNYRVRPETVRVK